MRNMKCWAVVLLLIPGCLQAVEINTAGKIFLLEPGARALGMGGCGTLLGEAYSGLSNPAAQGLTSDINGAVYVNPTPFFGPNYDFVTASFGAHSEFGYLGFSYLVRKGIDGTDFPTEEASSVVMAGRPSRKLPLSLGIAFKILTTSKSGFIPLNESWSKSYKMAFDFGIVYQGLLPQTTLRRENVERRYEPRMRWGRPFPRGISWGIAFQNIGGEIEFDDTPQTDMLPQLFRGDLMWGIYEGRRWDIKVAGQVQKLLVSRKKSDDPFEELGGFNKATDAFFTAWGGGSREGGWTARLGFEATLYSLFSGRIGWSKDYKSTYAFNYYGVGLGPEWLRLNLALEHMPGSDEGFGDEIRVDATASVTYKQLRDWIRRDDY